MWGGGGGGEAISSPLIHCIPRLQLGREESKLRIYFTTIIMFYTTVLIYRGTFIVYAEFILQQF